MKSSTVRSWIKYILIFSGAVVILSLVLFTAALMVLDDNDYRKLAVWGVGHLTGYRMIVEGPFLVDLSAEPSLTANGIRFEAFGADPSPRLTSIGLLHLKIALKPLLRGIVFFKRLQVEDVSVDTLKLREKYRVESRWDNLVHDFFVPVVENVTLANIKLSVADLISNREVRFHLNRFVMDDIRNSGPLHVKGDGFINETGFLKAGWERRPTFSPARGRTRWTSI